MQLLNVFMIKTCTLSFISVSISFVKVFRHFPGHFGRLFFVRPQPVPSCTLRSPSAAPLAALFTSLFAASGPDLQGAQTASLAGPSAVSTADLSAAPTVGLSAAPTADLQAAPTAALQAVSSLYLAAVSPADLLASFSWRLISFHMASPSSGVPAFASPKTWGWRRIIFRHTPSITS